jgi:hypothetical protein
LTLKILVNPDEGHFGRVEKKIEIGVEAEKRQKKGTNKVFDTIELSL